MEAKASPPFFAIELRCPGYDVSPHDPIIAELRDAGKLLTVPQHTEPLESMQVVRSCSSAVVHSVVVSGRRRGLDIDSEG